MTNIIIVKKRLTDNGRYPASLKGRPEIWETGDYIKAAIGDLVFSHPENFSVKVEGVAG